MKRVMVYGDSNSWGFPCDGSNVRMKDNWPSVMARHLGGIELIEENLPGRTTIHDDPEHMGKVNNGLRYIEVAMRSHAPLDAVVFLLGTNDLKARFNPTASTIAANLGRLIEEAQKVGGGSNIWDENEPTKIFAVAPPPLSTRVLDREWDRVEEWKGAYEASQGLAEEYTKTCSPLGVPVFDSAHFVEGGEDDPIHWTPQSHLRLGQAVAHWLSVQEF